MVEHQTRSSGPPGYVRRKKHKRDVNQFGIETKILAKNTENGYFGQQSPNFDHFWQFWGSKIFSNKKFFGGHLSHMETQLHAKKKIERSRL